jgi:ElaB/YqjD/DUF883 family membrane-anchored ribosome-binding protein
MSTMNTPTSNDPDVIREEIEVTRGRLSYDVDELTETVRPSNVARRQGQKVKRRTTALKERIMGSADDGRPGAGGAVGQLGDKASELGDRASGLGQEVGERAAQAPQAVRQQTQGNPLVAGAIALGVGWLVGSLLPASDVERQAAGELRDKAQPLVEEAKSVAQETAEDLKQPAREAAQQVKHTATESAENVKQEGQSTAQDVKASASESADRVSGS